MGLSSMAIGEDRRTVTSFLNDCIDVFKLFASDGQTFWSERLNRDLDQIVSKSIARSNAAKKRHNKNKNNYLNKGGSHERHKEILYNFYLNLDGMYVFFSGKS